MLASKHYKFALVSHFSLGLIRWILRDFYVIADFISKLVDFDDYAINDFVFDSEY